MPQTAERQRFLDYVHKTHLPEEKAGLCGKHYDTIQRELRRRGAWQPHARFLDVGCGLGLYTEYWHSRGLRVIGFDVDQDLIQVARERAAAKGLLIPYETGTAERLPFPDGSFDVVFANSILEHVPEWRGCLEEWIRVLAPGGLLWVETTNVLCPRQTEFRWLPLYSWWPRWMKRVAVWMARGPLPALANYSPCPALHWFSFFGLRRFLEARHLDVRDRFDCMEVSSAGPIKRSVRTVALASPVGRWFAYVLVSPLVILASRPAEGPRDVRGGITE